MHFQRGYKRVAFARFDADRVLRPNRGGFIAGARHDRNVGESVGIARRNAIAGRDLVREDFELFDQDRGLNRIQPAGDADARGLRAVGALTVQPNAFHPRG